MTVAVHYLIVSLGLCVCAHVCDVVGTYKKDVGST